jgi:CxxC-x17-CxxC domain-containing protein
MRDFNRTGGSRNFGFRGNDRPMMHQAVCDDCGRTCEVPFKPTGNKEVFCKECFDKRGGNEARAPRQEERNFNRVENTGRFDESYGNRPGRGSSNFERGSRMMFNATCDECGKPCQLPFRPSSNKPVYCSACFNMRGERSGVSNNSRDDRGNRDSRDDRGSRDNRDSRPARDNYVASSGSVKTVDSAKEIRELKDQMTSLNAKLEKIMKVLAINDNGAKVEKEAVKASTETKVKAVKKVVTNGIIVMNASDEASLLDDEPVKNTEAVKKAAPKKTAAKAKAKKAE